MAVEKLRREKIEGGFALSYQDLLKHFPEAAGVPQVAFDLKCNNAVVLKKFEPGEVICEEGEFGSTAFFVVSGKVNVFISSRASAGGGKKPGLFARVFGGARAGTAGGVTTMIRKMLTYGTGRGLEHYDQCNVKAIDQAIRKDNYKFSSLVLAVIKSEAFQKRRLLRPEEIQIRNEKSLELQEKN
jgi:hypothetical protein